MAPDSVIHSSNKRGGAGFTLVELMVVTAVAAVLITIATVGLVTMRRQSYVNGETRNLVSRLQNARMKAVAMGEKHGVYIGGPTDPQYPSQVLVFSKTPDATANVLEATDGGTDGGTDVVLFQQTLGDVSGRSTVQVNSVPTAGNVTIVFDPTGAATVSITTAGTTTTYDWTGGPYYFQLTNVDDSTSPSRQLMIRADGTVRVTQ